MKSRKTSFFKLALVILTLITITYNIGQTTPPPTISSVSMDAVTWVQPRVSMVGGTRLYITGTNFGTDPSLVSILIGLTYPCNLIAEGMKENTIPCTVTQAYVPNLLWALNVTVDVNGQSVTCSNNLCNVDYSESNTPFLQQITPRSAYGQTQINIYGYHKIATLGDGRSFGEGQVRQIKIGNIVCSLIDVINKDQINPNARQPIACSIYKNQESGQYNVTQNVFQGYARHSQRMRASSLFNPAFSYYEFRVLPVLSTLTSHQSGQFGSKVNVFGTGFSTDITKYNCKIAGELCSVVQANSQNLTIQIPEKSASNTLKGAIENSPSSNTKYLNGNGFQYTKYKKNSGNYYYSASTVELLINGTGLSDGYVVEEKIISELASGDIQDNYYVQHIRGYFYAPVAGDYNFNLVVDDAAAFYISQQVNQTDIQNIGKMNKVLQSTSYIGSHFVPFVKPDIKNDTTVTLSKGYYYMHVVAFDWGGGADYKIMMTTPQLPTVSNPANPTWQTTYFSIKPSAIDPQILEWKFNINNITHFTYQYSITTLPYYIRTGKININVSNPVTIRDNSAWYGLSQVWAYLPVVTYENLSSTDLNRTLRFTFNRYRPPTSRTPILIKLYQSDGTVKQQVLQTIISNHSDPISSTYGVTLDSSIIVKKYQNNSWSQPALPYKYYYWDLKSAIRQALNSPQIQIYQIMDTTYEDELSYIIQFVGHRSSVVIDADVSALLGGKVGSTIVKNITNLRQYNEKRPLFNPITSDFLYNSADTPTIQITVNNIPAVNKGDMSFDFLASNNVNLDTATLNPTTNTLTFNFTTTVALTDIQQVNLAGCQCGVVSQSSGTFTCTFARLNAGTSQKPQILLKNKGFANAASVTPINIGLTVASISPNKSNDKGGIIATLTGKGFPLDNKVTGYTINGTPTINFCNNTITQFISMSNTQIKFKIPPKDANMDCTTFVPVFKFAGQTSNTFAYTYDNSLSANITDFTPKTSSPIAKKTITITGNGFGDLTNTFVKLIQNGVVKYDLSITSITGTQIVAILGGGYTGNYQLQVLAPNGNAVFTNSLDNTFKYQVLVNNVYLVSGQPVVGSPGGAQTLIITGTNFIPFNPLNNEASNMNVFLGTSLQCKILSATQTQIQCQTPKKPIQVQSNIPLDVVVTSRITEQSICSGTCKFTYNPNIYSNVIVNSGNNTQTILSVPQAGSIVTIYANNSNTNMSQATKVTVGNAVISSFNQTDQSLAFAFPQLTVGQLYQIQIEFAPGIFNNPPLYVNSSIASITSYVKQNGLAFNSTISTQGHLVAALGDGLPKSKSDKGLQVYIVCSGIRQDLNVLEIGTTRILFQLPPRANGTLCNFNVSYKYKRPTQNEFVSVFKSKAITYSSSITPNCTLSSLSNSDSFTISSTNLSDIQKVYLYFSNINNSPTTSSFSMNYSSGTGQCTSSVVLPVGVFIPKILTASGYAKIISGTLQKAWSAQPSISNTLSASFAGGRRLIINGSGFLQNGIQNNDIRVCGLSTQIINVNNSNIQVSVPALITQSSQATYNLAKSQVVKGTYMSDANGTNPAYWTFDQNGNTFYSSSNLSECYIGYDFGDSLVKVEKIKFDPSNVWVRASSKLKGAVFQGYDGTQWVQIFAIDVNTVHLAWNYWYNVNSNSPSYSKIRFYQQNSNSSNANFYSQCQLAGLQITGKKISTASPPNDLCDVDIFNDGNKLTLAGKVQYLASQTASVTQITPAFGPSQGGTVIHIQGTNLISPIVVIDGINCNIEGNSTQTDLYCTTGKRAFPPSSGNSFIVTSQNNQVILNAKPYLYIDRFSQPSTWGGQAPPRQGDSIYVPKGKTLLVDQSTQKLYAVIVQGKIMFSDQKNMEFHAHYFVLNDGSQFQAGTQQKPYQSKLTFTMYGDYFDKQLPTFGNKGIGCKNCKFSMHGRIRQPTWTQLTQTVNPGDNSINVMHPVDWQTGEKIIVASTSLYHNQAQQMQIQSVDGSGTIITLTSSFKYKHLSTEQTYQNGQKLVMRGEVGLLSRNIVMQGDNTTDAISHGSHLVLTGKQSQGLVGHIAYSQFRKCGQPKIIGRYCTHFHMAGQVPESYVRGISVHHSHARILTIHGTHYLTVEKNVGYLVKGHNIFLEDGIQTNNVIQDNLVVSSLQSFTMTQSDITVASYWVTNPYNVVRRNHAAGGDFYGFWYQIMSHPEGPSATSDICPMGMQVQQSRDNVAHSYVRFGLRIFKLSARQNPCLQTEDNNAIDTYVSNPAIHTIFDNYTLWRNQQCGFLGQKLGYMTIQNFKVADNLKGGMQFHKTNFTHPVLEPVSAQNCLIVGRSRISIAQNNATQFLRYNGQDPNPDLQQIRKGTRGLFASRTDGFEAHSIHFANFEGAMTPFQSCSECYHFKLWVVGSKTSVYSNITYQTSNGVSTITGNYIFWQKWQRAIFIDLDNSMAKDLTSKITSVDWTNSANLPVQFTPYRANLINSNSITNQSYIEMKGANPQTQCFYDNVNTTLKDQFQTKWNHAIVCRNGSANNPSNILRSIIFTNMNPSQDFKGTDLRVRKLINPGQIITKNLTANFSGAPLYQFGTANQVVIKPPSNDIPGAFSMPFRTGKIYNVHWKDGIDFESMTVGPSAYWKSGYYNGSDWVDTNQRVLLRFNYSDQREAFIVNRIKNNNQIITPSYNIKEKNNQTAWGLRVFDFNQTNTLYNGVCDPKNTSFFHGQPQDLAPPQCDGYDISLPAIYSHYKYVANFGQNAPSCKNGQYFNDRQNKYFWLCVSGDSAGNQTNQQVRSLSNNGVLEPDFAKPVQQWIQVAGIKCILQCPSADQNTQYIDYMWSNTETQNLIQIPGLNLPLIGGNITIENTQSVRINDNITQIVLERLQIRGRLIVKQSTLQNSLKIRAKTIIVHPFAQFLIGTIDSPINNKRVTVVLDGQKSDNYTVLDATASGNKMLGVMGRIGFYSKGPQKSWTRLYETAIVGGTTIKVLNANDIIDWNVGDEIILAPTYKDPKQFEKAIIKSKSGNVITLNSSLIYEHYGSNDTTAKRNNTSSAPRDLDARGAVGLLTRKIKVTNGTDPNGDYWGCRILASSAFDSNTGKIFRGVIKMGGVQISGCGQYDSTMAGIRMQNLGSLSDTINNTGISFNFNYNSVNLTANPKLMQYYDKNRNFIENSSIHTCNGYCMYIADSRDFNISNNVLFHAQRQIVHVEKVLFYNFTSNLLIYAHKRAEMTATLEQVHLTEDVACYQQYKQLALPPLQAKVLVSDNLAQGSQGQGFVFPLIDCNYLQDYPFQHNTAGTCQIGFMYQKLYDTSPSCLGASSMIAYASQIGLMANPPGQHIRLKYQNGFFADNQRGITLRFAHQTDNNTMLVENSQFLGYSRTDDSVNQKIQWCNGGYAVRMFTATISGQTFPLKKAAVVHDVICTQQAFEFKAFMKNVIFQNYRNMPAVNGPATCKSMSVFKRHGGASDGTAPHYLQDCYCYNCDKKGLAGFDSPNPSWSGWFGGCGSMNCTGPDNIIIHDVNGTFVKQALGHSVNTPTQLYGQGVIQYQQGNFNYTNAPCQFVDNSHNPYFGFVCENSQQLVLLHYQSIAPDFQKRIIWPISIFDDQYFRGPDSSNFYSLTNGWKQWKWDGPQPMNLRLARFWSVIRKNKSYNISYASQGPADSRYQLNRRDSRSDPIPQSLLQYVVLRIYYPLPNSIQVLVNGNVIKPQIRNGTIMADLAKDWKTVCGANNFHFENGTIQFVVNNLNACQVQVRLTSSIKISMRVDVAVKDFYQNTATSFISNIAAFLNIDPGRIKIVSVKQGSTVIEYFITALAQTDPVKNQQTYNILKQIVQKLKQAAANGNIDFGGIVLEFNAQINMISADGTLFSPTDDNLTTILIAVLVPSSVLIIAIAIGVFCYLKRRRAKVGNQDQFNQVGSIDSVNDKPTREYVQVQKMKDQSMLSEGNI